MANAEIESVSRPRPPVLARVDTIIKEVPTDPKNINLRDNSDSIWLRNHMVWCIMHGATLVISAA